MRPNAPCRVCLGWLYRSARRVGRDRPGSSRLPLERKVLVFDAAGGPTRPAPTGRAAGVNCVPAAATVLDRIRRPRILGGRSALDGRDATGGDAA